MIAIIDYGAGNVKSVKNALDYLGFDSLITSDVDEIRKAERVIFPGVGNFGDCMQELEERKLVEVIKKFIDSGKPFLGICVGLQLLFEKSEESPGVNGLDVFKGKCVKFNQGKVPQIGWNKIKSKKFGEGYVYFVNSYYAIPDDNSVVDATSDYFVDFTAIVEKDNVLATQFHPEKSGDFGLQILKRWLQC